MAAARRATFAAAFNENDAPSRDATGGQGLLQRRPSSTDPSRSAVDACQLHPSPLREGCMEQGRLCKTKPAQAHGGAGASFDHGRAPWLPMLPVQPSFTILHTRIASLHCPLHTYSSRRRHRFRSTPPASPRFSRSHHPTTLVHHTQGCGSSTTRVQSLRRDW